MLFAHLVYVQNEGFRKTKSSSLLTFLNKTPFEFFFRLFSVVLESHDAFMMTSCICVLFGCRCSGLLLPALVFASSPPMWQRRL